MNRRLGIAILVSLNILALGLFLYQYAGAAYPLVGHDYRLFASRLVDTFLHYKVNGLTIQWYTPNFGAGLPAYANPLQAQFSIPQFALIFVDPWNAILLSSAIYALLGFMGIFFFLKDALGYKPISAVLGGVLFTLNGFFIERVVVGHVNFITFPLITLYLLALMHSRLPILMAAILIALTSGALIYSGSVYIGLIALFSLLICLPLVYLLKPSLVAWRRIVPILLLGGMLSMFLCGSKLYATSLYMANFPRIVHDEYAASWITGTGGMIFQLLGVMSTAPFLALVGKSGMVFVARLAQWTQTPYGFWELDSSLSPILLLLLAVGAGKILKRKPPKSFTWAKVIAAVFLLLAIYLAAQFAIAKGPFFHALRILPVLESLHANTRYTASFILPLAILAAGIFDSWVTRQNRKSRPVVGFLLLDGLALAALWSYTLVPLDVQNRNFDMTPLLETYTQIQAGETLPVKNIVPAMQDYEVFLFGASNTTAHYEPLFRDNNEAFHPIVHEGSVYDLEEGYFNMTNPSGYLFPEENNTSIYARIPESDQEKLIQFVNHRQPEWKISRIQMLLNVVSAVAFIFEGLGLGFYLVKQGKRKSLPSA